MAPNTTINKVIGRQVYENEEIVIAESLGDLLVTFVASAAVFTLGLSCCTGIGL